MPNGVGPPKKLSQLEIIDQKILQLKQRRQKIEARQTLQERKNRARRLIQYGAIAVKFLDCGYNIEPKEFEQLFKDLMAKIKNTAQS